MPVCKCLCVSLVNQFFLELSLLKSNKITP